MASSCLDVTVTGQEDCVIISNSIATDSDRISTKLRDIISEEGNNALSTTSVSRSSLPSEKTNAKKIIAERSSVFVMTEDMLTNGRSFLYEMIESMANRSNVVVVGYKLTDNKVYSRVPLKFREHHVIIDWDDPQFKSKFIAAINRYKTSKSSVLFLF